MATTYSHMIDVIFAVKKAGASKAQVKAFFKELNKGQKTAKKASKSIKKVSRKMGDFEKAMRRAAIVAPVWMALRSAMQAVFRTISEGAKYWEEFDKAIQKSAQVIHEFSGTIEEAVEGLTSRIRELSIETGKSMAQLSSSFYRFGTVGINLENSMRGMEVSTKLANTMFGNSDEIARVLAQAYRLLGDSIDKTIPESKKMAVVGAQIFKLWKTNAFEIGGFQSALQQFLPIANTMNISLTETNALLATLQTAGLKDSKAGRLLRTSISKLVENLDDVALVLGVDVNPQLDSTFDVLMKVLGAVKKLEQSGGRLPVEQFQALGLFGGVRSKQAAMALVALYDTLQKNLADINTEQGKYNKLLDEQEEANQRVLKSTHKQIEIFRNLRKLLGQAFVKGVVGAEDFAIALKKINEDMLALIKAGRIVGQVFGGILEGIEAILMVKLPRSVEKVWLPPWVDPDIKRKVNDVIKLEDQLNRVRKGQIPVQEKIISIEEHRMKLHEERLNKIKTEIDWQKELNRMEKEKPLLPPSVARYMKPKGLPLGMLHMGVALKLYPEIARYNVSITKQQKEQEKTQRGISRELETQLVLLEKELIYIEMEVRGYKSAEIEQRKLSDYISKRIILFNQTDRVMRGQTEALNEQKIISMALAGNYTKILSLIGGMIDKENFILGIENKRLKISEARLKSKKEEHGIIRDLVLEYEKAEFGERRGIKRLIELQVMQPQQVKQQFETSAYDKRLILENVNQFTEEVKNLISQSLARQRGWYELTSRSNPYTGGVKTPYTQTAGRVERQQIQPIRNITNVGANNININVEATANAEEIASETAKKVKSSLLIDEDFQKVFSKKISNKI